MNRTLYIQHTIRLLKLYIDMNDYKTSFFILINALGNMNEDYFDLLTDSFDQHTCDPSLHNIEKN